jgi:hypothetical protein
MRNRSKCRPTPTRLYVAPQEEQYVFSFLKNKPTPAEQKKTNRQEAIQLLFQGKEFWWTKIKKKNLMDECRKHYGF